MQITLKHEKLVRAMGYIVRGISSKPNIPVLSNVLLSVEQGLLKLSSTNLDMGINLWIAGQAVTTGSVTVSAKILYDFLNAAKSTKVELQLDGNVFKVKTDNSTAKFQTIPAGEFPILPNVTGKPSITADPGQLADALHKVIFACATDNVPGKSQLTGVFFELSDEDNTLNLVGLDTYRLSLKRLKVRRVEAEKVSAIVPARSLSELLRVLESEQDVESVDIYVHPQKNQIIFKFNEVELSIRLLEGPYPDYQRVIPTEFEFEMEVDKDEFESSLKVVNTFARSLFGSRTELDTDPATGKMQLSSTVSDLGDNQTMLPVFNYKGKELRAAYSLKYMAEMTSSMKGERVSLKTKSALSPALFTDNDDPNYQHIIMPLTRD